VRSIVVYGPPACGKTRNAEALAAHFELEAIVDDFDPARHRLVPGALHLSHTPYEGPGARSFLFSGLKFNPNGRARITFLRPIERRTFG
jgi:hypothetical protein